MNTPSAANGKGGGENQVAKNLNVDPIFDAANIALQRRMRFNPLRALDPENLSIALDQFEIGILRQAAMLWEAMCKRDDTLVTVKPQLENSVASKAWGVFKKKGADEKEAARHAAALEYFYEHASATDAFDRNERGGRERLIAQMMRADSFNYAVHHFVWRPQPGKMIDVEGAAPVPALTAELEYVPLWYFENTTGTLRFLPYGGFGVIGAEMDFENEWMVTTGRGLMFAAAICYVFKRLTFQDWTIFNERYAQNKVVGMTNATKESSQGQALLQVIADFNGDQGIAFFECGNTDKPPIQLLGPQGAVTAEIFEKFIERQDRKIASMFRGNDLSMMSRGGKGERAAGASLQKDEGDAMERGACKMIAGALHEGIDRKVIRYCFGEDVEPLAYFGLPDMDVENTKDLRESAGFLADRGAKVAIENVADRLGVQLATDQEEALQPVQSGANTESLPVETQTANAQIESEAVALLRTVEEALRTANGDVPGHEFHGNQWSGGGVTEGHVKLSGSKVIKESDKAVLTHVQLKEGSTELWLPKSHASVDESGTVHASPWIIDQKERGFDESHNPDLRGESIRTGDHTERPKMSHEEQTRMLKDNTDRNARNEAARDKAAEKREAGKGEKEARIARARVDQIKSTHLPSAQKELERVAANPSATKALGRAQSRIDDLKGEMERLTKQHAL